MKLNGFVGKGSGKLGSSVFAISGGEQIVREYNPRVANPNTDAQVAQRAKMKLMSQLAAALAPALAFKKVKLVSARNQFVAKNIGLCEYENKVATCDLQNLQLTPGSRHFPEVFVDMGEQDVVTITTHDSISEDVEKVVVVIAKETEDFRIAMLDEQIVDVSTTHTLNATYTNTAQDNLFIFAYGWIPTNGANAASYGNYEAEAGTKKADLSTTMAEILAGGAWTLTKMTSLEA